MLRCLATIVGATLLPLAVVGSSSGGGSSSIPGAAIETAAPVIMLAADGTTVAAVVGSSSTLCGEQALVWDVRRRAPVVMRGRVDSTGGNYCRGTPDDLGLAVGGGMVGLLRLSPGCRGSVCDVPEHNETSTLSVTRLPTTGRWTDVTYASNYSYGAGDGDYLSVLGDGTLLAFDRWTVCFPYDGGEVCPGVSTDGFWWVSNGRLARVNRPGSAKPWRLIGSGRSFVGAVALDRGRFVVLPPKGRLTVVDASTGRTTQLPVASNTVRQADLDGEDLVILRTATGGIPVLDLRDASTGTFRRTFALSHVPVPAKTVHLEDAHAGIAVYRIGTTIHLLRTSDGKSRAIALAANQAPVHARLEDPGLVYSFSLPAKEPRGRIAFVPLTQLLARFR